MNERINEWINEWMNEWMNERMNEWRNEGSVCMHVYVYACYVWVKWSEVK